MMRSQQSVRVKVDGKNSLGGMEKSGPIKTNNLQGKRVLEVVEVRSVRTAYPCRLVSNT